MLFKKGYCPQGAGYEAETLQRKEKIRTYFRTLANNYDSFSYAAAYAGAAALGDKRHAVKSTRSVTKVWRR